MKPRAQKVAGVFKEEISRIIREELRDPRIGFITITDVELTDDLRFAKIYYSILGSAKDKEETAKALESGLGFMRRLIGRNIKLRYTPEIKFVLDESGEHSINIQEILNRIDQESREGE